MHSDFLLIILKDMLRVRPDLKILLMSAALHVELFTAYFDNCPRLHIRGFCYPVKQFFLEVTSTLDQTNQPKKKEKKESKKKRKE